MSVVADWRRIKSGEARLPRSAQLANVMLALDGIILAFALADIAGFDMSSAGVTLLGSGYTFDEPTFPWIVGVLGALSVTAGWFGAQGRRFAFELGVALTWSGLATAAIVLGSGPGLLAWRLLIVAALLRGRRGFVS
jgi:hypothetical protein